MLINCACRLPRYTYYAPDEELLIDLMVSGDVHEFCVKELCDAGGRTESDIKKAFSRDPPIFKYLATRKIKFKEDSAHARSSMQPDFAIGLLDKKTDQRVYKIAGEVAVTQSEKNLDKRIRTILEQSDSYTAVITIVLRELKVYHNPIPIGDQTSLDTVLGLKYNDFAVSEIDPLGPIKARGFVWSHRREAFAEIWRRDENGKAERIGSKMVRR